MSKGMMKVKLNNTWFDKDSKFWEPGVYDMPQAVEPLLPVSAQILNEDGDVDEAAMKKKRDREAGIAVATEEAEEDEAKPDKTVKVPLK